MGRGGGVRRAGGFHPSAGTVGRAVVGSGRRGPGRGRAVGGPAQPPGRWAGVPYIGSAPDRPPGGTGGGSARTGPASGLAGNVTRLTVDDRCTVAPSGVTLILRYVGNLRLRV